MMDRKSFRVLPGVLAVGIYLLVVGLLLLYFNAKSEEKAKRYVKKDEHRIQVALSSSSSPLKKKEKVKAKKKLPKKKKAEKKKIDKKKKAAPEKHTKKRVIKEKIVKKKRVKKRDVNKRKPKKRNNTKDLFANVKAPKKKNLIQVSSKPLKTKPKKNLIKVTDDKKSASSRINRSLKEQKSSSKGVESAYLARVQSMLEGWPAQSEYAGEKVKVILFIRPSGFFDFKIKSASRNHDFNRGLSEYLEQLQEFGFGPHKGERTYNFEAEFIAKG